MIFYNCAASSFCGNLGYSYDHMLYNHRPYSLVGCNCTQQLQECLQNVTASSLAEEILEVWFGKTASEGGSSTTPLCLTIERKQEKCVRWDNFYQR